MVVFGEGQKSMFIFVFLIFHVLSHSVMLDSLLPSGLQPTRLLCPWNSPGKNTTVGRHTLFQGIFPTQGSKPGLPHCRQILYCLSHQRSPKVWTPCTTGCSKMKVFQGQINLGSTMQILVALGVKNLPANAGDIRDTGPIPGSRRSPGKGYGYLCQYSCLENPMDKGA